MCNGKGSRMIFSKSKLIRNKNIVLIPKLKSFRLVIVSITRILLKTDKIDGLI